MSKTWWGHYIIIDKGEEYIRFKDYLELSNRIDKAIEYIEWQRVHPQYDNVWRRYECDELLEILKGEKNE